MAPATEQLVGRAVELGVLDVALASAEGRAFAALALVGEPGIGKTRLLAELGSRADARRHITLAGRASDFERELPFWVFVDALDEYLAGLEPRRLSSLEQDTLAELAHVFPSLLSVARTSRERQDERYRTHRAVRRLIEALAETKPLVLLLDDVHWADSASIELVGSLLRRPPSAPVLLAMAMRPRQVPERLAGVLERAHREEKLVRIEIGALSADEARQLLGGDVDGRAAAALYEEAGGNPFYLQQLARSPNASRGRRGDGGGVALAGVEVPRAVAAAMADELALLPRNTRRVLEGAAVAGDPFEPELAAAAADVAEQSVVEALDELVARDFVRPMQVPRRFRFRHPLVRGAVYEAAPAGWRLGAHERSAAALAAHGASAVARAHHVERCARMGDSGAVAVLKEAAITVAPRAPVTAAHLLGAAIRLLPSSAPAEERVELLGARAQAQAAAGEFRAAHTSLVECLEYLPDSPLPRRLQITAACAGLENLLGSHEEAHARLMAALEELSDPTSSEAAVLMAELAVDCFYRMEYESMADWARRALETARPLGGLTITAAAAGMLALAESLRGQTADVEAACAEGAALVDAMDDEELAPRIDWAINTLAVSELYLGRLEAAGAHSARALALADSTGQGEVLPILFWGGFIRATRGQLDESAAMLDRAVEVARLASHAEGLAWNLFARSLTATAAGDSELALSTAEEAVEALSEGGRATFLGMGTGIALASALLEVDAPERAADVLRETAGGDTLAHVPACWRSAAFEVLTRSQLGAGRREEAITAVERGAALAEALGTQAARAASERAAAALALDSGDPGAAAEHALTAAAAFGELGAAVEEAIARVAAGRALAASGDKPRAVAELERAAAAFEACGALARRDGAERELGRLGRRPYRRSRRGEAGADGVASLTERELEVAWLVVERKTNAEIAADLFLSPKTVESHLRHLFQKLGVGSRVEVARAVERADRRSPRPE